MSRSSVWVLAYFFENLDRCLIGASQFMFTADIRGRRARRDCPA